MTDVNPATFLIALNVNVLNTPMKRQKLDEIKT